MGFEDYMEEEGFTDPDEYLDWLASQAEAMEHLNEKEEYEVLENGADWRYDEEEEYGVLESGEDFRGSTEAASALMKQIWLVAFFGTPIVLALTAAAVATSTSFWLLVGCSYYAGMAITWPLKGGGEHVLFSRKPRLAWYFIGLPLVVYITLWNMGGPGEIMSEPFFLRVMFLWVPSFFIHFAGTWAMFVLEEIEEQ